MLGVRAVKGHESTLSSAMNLLSIQNQKDTAPAPMPKANSMKCACDIGRMGQYGRNARGESDSPATQPEDARLLLMQQQGKQQQ